MIQIIVISMLCEAVWESLKMVWQGEKHLTLDKFGALVMSVLISFATGLDLLVLLEIDSSIPYIGVLLTGILLSRGANFLHDLISKLSNSSKPSVSLDKEKSSVSVIK